MSDINKIIDDKLKEKKIIETEVVNEEKNLDTIQEQIEAPMTTIHCTDSIKEKELKKIDKNPENYIEVNMVKKIRIVDSFYISSKLKEFKYKDITYKIDEENIYIFATKNDYFMPTSFFYESNTNPISFKQKNKGITGKALSLLYNKKLYQDLFSSDEYQYNLFIVVFLLISITGYFIGLYYLLGGSI